MTVAELERQLILPFSLENWRVLLQSLLPGLELSTQLTDIPLTTKSEKAAATKRHQFGRARLSDGKGLGLFVIEAHPDIDLLRNRVGLRELAVSWIDEASLHGVFAFFHQPGTGHYRLTYAARESALTPDLQLTTNETATRRFTYVLGDGERRRTAAQRLSLLVDRRPELTLSDVTDAFSVEKLNREFFADFCRVRATLTDDIEARNELDTGVARSEAQTILNRLLFLYFLQRKGWLHRQKDYLAAQFSSHAGADPDGTSFYKRFLFPVFSILSSEWAQRESVGHSQDDPHAHDLPFLNGGLFSDEIAAIHSESAVMRRRRLRIGNSVFHQAFTDLFERYNFTIHEDSDRDAEVAVDPEMLGRIFEELVLTSEESESGGKSRRHDTGSHYTPRPIVRYLCRENLGAWLADQPPFASMEEPRRIVDELLALDGSIGLDDDTWKSLRRLLTANQAAMALDALLELRACDPAVGSGAFPLGLLHELLNVARLLDALARGKDPGETDLDWLYQTKKRLIERCIYGTDIQEEALEICKLRLWLSLMVDHELGVDPDRCERRAFARALRAVEPLPNLEFKIRRANALVDTIRGHRLHIARPRQDVRIRPVLSRLGDAKRDFYAARSAAQKRRLRLTIYQATAELAQHELSWMKGALGLSLGDSPEIRQQLLEIQEAEHAVGHIRKQLDSARKLKAAAQEDALDRLQAWWNDPEHPTFVWHFDFAEVFHRSPRLATSSDNLLAEDSPLSAKEGDALHGFDQMLGNPPYIRLQVLKRDTPEDAEWYREHYEAASKGNYDLYVVFIERALQLLHGDGQLAFICPHKFFNAQYGEPLRGLIAAGRHLRHVVHFGDQQIFPGATNFVCLLFLSKHASEHCDFIRAHNLKLWLAAGSGDRANIGGKKIKRDEWNFVVGQGTDVFEHLNRVSRKLRDVTDRIFQGLVTGADSVFILHKTETKGHFMSEATGRCHNLEEALVHPLCKGSLDVRRYYIEPVTRFILFPYVIRDGRAELLAQSELEKKHPKAWHYLCENRQQLERREGGKWRHERWHAFGRSQALSEMEQAKILTPSIAAAPSFTFDARGEFYFIGSGGGGGGGYGITLNAKAHVTSLSLLAILNSAVTSFVIRKISTTFRGGYFGYSRQFIEDLPIPETSRNQRDQLEKLASWLLFLHRQPSVRTATTEHPRDPQMSVWFERWVNALVYELFFPEELRSKGLNFISFTEDFAPPAPELDADTGPTLRMARSLVERLSAPGHALRRALDQLQTLDIVRTIEGGS